jgi:hypothetical protein
MMRICCLAAVCCLVLSTGPSSARLVAAAGEHAGAAPGPVAAGKAVISSDSYVRAFLAFRTPVVATKESEIKVALDPGTIWGPPKVPGPLPDFQSPLPPEDWAGPDFDDTAWDRRRSPVEMEPEWWGGQAALHSATINSIIFLRWKFGVDDPAQARDLKLSLVYVGGLAVFVNGKELTRANLPAGELKPEALAEKYPDDLYVLEGNKMLVQTWHGNTIREEHRAAFDRRYRRIESFVVPAEMLRKGSNVLAVRIHRAPAGAAAIAAERFMENGMSTRQGLWAGAGLKSIALVSASGAGVVPNVTRPKDIQVWNVAPFQTITAFDYGDAGDTVKPVTVAAVRNSVFSGRLAVSADRAIKGLKVTVGELRESKGGGTLPATTVKVRYAEPAVAGKSWAPAHRFDGLLEAIPAEIPVITAPPVDEKYLNWPIARSGIACGAVASLWLTARVPKDAKSGRYEGTVTVEAEGLKPTAVPFQLTVHDWVLPDPKDFRQHHLIFLSQEAVAKHYGAELWSDKHFALMGKSMDLLAEVNSREVPMNLGINFYGVTEADVSNTESMVRWVKQADGSFKYDFTVFDKYCDLVAKHYGKPFPLRLNCWGEVKNQNGKLLHNGVTSVSRLDPVTGKVEPMEQPVPGTEESYTFWKPVIDEALRKMKDRGWLDATAFGHSSYCTYAKPSVVSVAKKLWPEGVWAYTAHNGSLGAVWPAAEPGVTMPVKFSVCVWTEGPLVPRGGAALLRPRPSIWGDTARARHWDWSPLLVVRNLPEEVIQRGHDGVGDFGSDLFPIKKEKGNGFYCLGNGRGTGGPNDAQKAILAPGPDGAVATERFENFREGSELSEAVLFLEKALLDGRVSGELAAKVNRCLTARAKVFTKLWYERGLQFINRWSPAGLVDRDAELLALCAEVASAAKVAATTGAK